MARGHIVPFQAAREGVAVTVTTGDASNGHYVENDGMTAILAKNTNGSATARTITFLTPGTVDGQAVGDRTESIPAGETQFFGPFPTASYGRTLNIDVSHAEVTLEALRVVPAG